MKSNYLTLSIIIIGLLILFFFPEPETNFFAYVGTAFIFIIFTLFSIILTKNSKKFK